MQALSAASMLDITDRAQGRHPVERALVLLAAGFPEAADQIADWTLGERDVGLLALRESLFGPSLVGVSECPRCGQRVELSVPTSRLLPRKDPRPRELSPLETGPFRIRCRLPTSRDLAAVAACPSLARGREILLSRCILEVRRDGARVLWSDLSDEALARVSDALEEADPATEVLFRLQCVSCGHVWDLLFDVAAFFWAEIAARAERLLDEVALLSRAFGWSEEAILALAPERRRRYLERARS